MKQKKYLLLLPVVALTLVGCTPTENPSTSGESTTTTSEPSSTTTSESSPTITPASVLSALQGDLTLNGTLDTVQTLLDEEGNEIADETDQFESVLTVHVGSGEYYIKEVDTLDGYLYGENHYWKNPETGGTIGYYLNYDNTVSYVNYVDQNNSPVLFDLMFFNPFIYVDESSISVSGNTAKISIDDSEIQQLVASTLTGYVFSIKTFTVTLTNEGSLSNIYIESNVDASEDDYGNLYNVTNVLDASVVAKEEYVPAMPQPKEMSQEQEALESAFATLRQHNYTVTYTETKQGETEPSISIEGIFTENAVLGTTNGGATSGYVNTSSGMVNVAVLDNGDDTVTLKGLAPADPETTILEFDLALPFDYSAAIFDVNPDGSFTLPVDELGMWYSDLARTCPDYTFGGSCEYALEGSLNIVLGESTITFSYVISMLNWDTWETEDYDCVAVVSNIGTTVCPYDIESSYEPFTTPTNWTEVSPELAQTFETMYGSSDAVPFYCPESGWETMDANIAMPYVGIYTTTRAESQAYFDAYVEILESAGFTFRGYNDYGEFLYSDGLVVAGLYIQEPYFSPDYAFIVYFYDASTLPSEPADVTIPLTTWADVDAENGTNICEILEDFFGPDYESVLPALDVDDGWQVIAGGMYINGNYTVDHALDTNPEAGYEILANALIAAGFEADPEYEGDFYSADGTQLVSISVGYGLVTIGLTNLA